MQISVMAKGIGESQTLSLDAKYKAMLAAGEDIIGFGAGEPDFDTPAHIKQAAIDAIMGGFTKYTPVAGIPELRKAICDTIGLGYTPEQIVVSNGAKQSLMNAFLAILNPEDEVIVPQPYWVSYPEMIKIARGVPRFAATTKESGFKVTIEMLKATATPKTQALVMNYPSNPLGVSYTENELRQIAGFAIDRGWYILLDEIYDKIIFDGAGHVSIASLGEEIKAHTIVINGVSKSYSMTGWRIGYSASSTELAEVMTKIQAHTTSNPCSISQKAAYAALTGPQDDVTRMRGIFEERRNFLMKELDKIGVPFVKPRGAFYIMLDIRELLNPNEDTEAFCTGLINDAKLLLIPGTGFGAEGFVRWSFASDIKKISKGIKRLQAFIQKRRG